jgi:uncharacterized protein with GYD domain
MKQRPLAPERLSTLIGKIYDCAIQPDQWPATIAEICRSIGCLSGLLLLIDLQRSQHRLAHAWGMSPGWERRFLKHSEFITEFYRAAFSRAICPDGEPQLLSPLVEAAGPRAQSVYAELLQSAGVSEAMQTVVLRQARRLAVFGAIVDMPDNVSMFALSVAVSASGFVRINTIPLLTVEEAEQALAKSRTC